MRFLTSLFIAGFIYMFAGPSSAQTVPVHDTGVHETGLRPYPRPRPVVMPRLVASYAEVLRDHHVQPLGAQIGACLGASDRRELDLIYRLERPYGASSFTLRSFDAYYHVRHGGTLMDPGYSYLFEAPDANTLTSDVAACLNRVIRAQPLPAPYGMDSGANMYEARVTFTAPAPSRSRSSRRH